MAKILFVTGKLAAKALEKTLLMMKPDFDYKIQVLPITVAALMNTEFIVNNVNPLDYDRLVIPGACRADTQKISGYLKMETVTGPQDLRSLPSFFGQQELIGEYGHYSIKIVAEIVDAPLLSTGEILARAGYYQEQGAGIIDLGCCHDRPFPHLQEAVQELKGQGFVVSVDTFNPGEILAAQEAGVDLVLSINSSNMEIAPELRTKVVVVPDFDQGLVSLEKNMEKLSRYGVEFIVDPVLDPINFGFADSLQRFFEMRRKYPAVEMMMGTGNVTELTDADTTGINALLTGIATELNINYILTTEASHRTKGVVKELDLARKLMYYSRQQGILPKRIDARLLTIKDREAYRFSHEELREMQALIRDKNYRIFTGEQSIYVLNKKHFLQDRDIDKIFNRLEVQDAKHAFYLGKELSKANLALLLGKGYWQDEELNWGLYSEQFNKTLAKGGE
jgi:dihydropteroate synthase-like protein